MNKLLKFASLLLATTAGAAQAGAGAIWSSNTTACTQCTVSVLGGAVEVATAAPVLGLVLDAEQSNVIDRTLTDMLFLFLGGSQVGSIDLSNVGFDPLDVPVGTSVFGGPTGTRLVKNFSFVHSGYLTVQSTDSFDRVRFVGPDSVMVYDPGQGTYVGTVPEPGTAAMLLAGACLLFSLGCRRAMHA